MPGMFDFNDPGSQAQMMGMLGALGPLMGPSRLPVSNGQVLASLAGGLAAGRRQASVYDALGSMPPPMGIPPAQWESMKKLPPEMLLPVLSKGFEGMMAAAQPPTQFQSQELGLRREQNQRLADQFKTTQDELNQRATEQRNFQESQNSLNRENAMSIAKLRADASLGAASNVQSVQQVLLNDGRAGLLTVYRNGKREVTTMDGQPVISSSRDPNALFGQSAARSAGTAAGTQAEAFPTVEANFKVINESLDALKEPNVKAQASRALGLGGLLPPIPGVNSDFLSRVAQLKGQTFLQAFNTLRGGGQITEVEGAKATDAIARLSRAQTPTEFYKALDDASGTFKTLFNSAKTRASRGSVTEPLQGATQNDALAQPQGGRIPFANAGGASPYKSADDVKAAVQAGKLNREQALGILRMQFGMQ